LFCLYRRKKQRLPSQLQLLCTSFSSPETKRTDGNVFLGTLWLSERWRCSSESSMSRRELSFRPHTSIRARFSSSTEAISPGRLLSFWIKRVGLRGFFFMEKAASY